MCFMCDGGTFEDEYGRIDRLVRDGQWSLMSVGGLRPWTYTIGLADHGAAELVMLGPPQQAGMILNELGRRQLDGLTLEVDGTVDVDARSFRIGTVDPRHVERGLIDMWVGYHQWRGEAPRVRLLQVQEISDSVNPLLAARSLAGTADPLDLKGKLLGPSDRPGNRRVS
jgi:hypothetical protein